MLSWTWGVRQLERYVTQLESQPRPEPSSEAGLIFDSFFDVTASIPDDKGAAAGAPTAAAHALGAGGLPTGSPKELDPRVQLRLKQRSLRLLAHAAYLRPQRITPKPRPQTTGAFVKYGGIDGEAMSRDESPHGLAFGDGIHGRVPTTAQYSLLRWSGQKPAAQTVHLHLKANGNSSEVDVEPIAQKKGGGSRPTEEVAFYYNKIDAQHLPQATADKATPSLHLATNKGEHIGGQGALDVESATGKKSGGDSRPTEEVAFYYNKIHAQHLPQATAGKGTASLHLASNTGEHAKGGNAETTRYNRMLWMTSR